jgi:hypothetical protein
MMRFGYVVLITLLYELTRGIGRNTICLIEIIIGDFLENKKEIHLQGSLVADRSLFSTVGSCSFLDMWCA